MYKSPSRSSDILCRYANSILQKGSKVAQEGETEDLLKQVVGLLIIFVFIVIVICNKIIVKFLVKLKRELDIDERICIILIITVSYLRRLHLVVGLAQ